MTKYSLRAEARPRASSRSRGSARRGTAPRACARRCRRSRSARRRPRRAGRSPASGYVPPSLQSCFAAAGAWKTTISPRCGSRKRKTIFATSTRSFSRAVHPSVGRAQTQRGLHRRGRHAEGLDDLGLDDERRAQRATASVTTHSTIGRRRTRRGGGLVAEVVAGAVGRADARDDRLLRTLVQPLAAALHGERNLSRLTSSVDRMPSAQSSISRRVSRAWRRASSTMSCA